MNRLFNIVAIVKHLLPVFIAVALLSSCGNSKVSVETDIYSNSDSTAVPEISFNAMVHDFGVITEGENVAFVFNFTNTGTGSLVVNSATTTCGCTVPKYSKKPLSPGEKGTLEVVFNSNGYGGMQTKTVTVQSNAKTPVVILAIKADVRSKNK